MNRRRGLVFGVVALLALMWAAPQTAALPADAVADRVFGQGGSFGSSTCDLGGRSATSLCGAHGVAVDGAGNLYVADFSNGRVLEYDSPLTTDTVADRVFGQSSFTSGGCNVGGISAGSLCGATDMVVDGAGNLYVADQNNGRVLEYDSPLTTDTVADRAFGQSSFTTNTCNLGGISASSLCGPRGVAVDGAGNLYVADSSNSRVLEYDSPLTTDAVADLVFGQSSFTSGSCNPGGISASSLCFPHNVAVDAAANLYVDDNGNHRALEYDSAVTADAVADEVFGQGGSFTSGACYLGGTSDNSLCGPHDVAVDGTGNLYVADQGNRVLEYDSPLSTDTAADRVLGQGGSFTTVTCNLGGISASSLCDPFGVTVDGAGNVYVADFSNNRVLEYDNPLLIPSLSINDVSLTEGNSGTTNAVFVVTLSAASGQTVTAGFATADGTATAGSDYVTNSGTLTFLPGQTAKPIVVTVNGDTLIESDETFFVNLGTQTNASIADAQGVGTILTNEPPPAPTVSVSLCAHTGSGCSPDNIIAGANADITTSITIAGGDRNFRYLAALVPQSSSVTAGSSLPLGAVAGALTATKTLGLLNNNCNSSIIIPFALMNGTTNTAMTVSPLATTALTDPFSEGVMEPLRDDNGGGAPVNGLPAHVDLYPSYLNTIFDPDGAGGAPPLTPLARYSGSQIVVGRAVIAELVVLSPGALGAFPSTHPFAELASAAQGYPTVLVFRDPSATVADPTFWGLTDDCSPVDSRILLWGKTRDNPCTGAVCTEAQMNNPPYVDSPAGACMGTDEGGCVRYANPAVTGSHQWRGWLQSLRDADNDGIENELDTCPTTANSGYDPRVSGAGGVGGTNDPDSDMIPGGGPGGGCDPTPSVNTNSNNHDADVDPTLAQVWPNAGDNCPLVANGTQTDTDLDGIGDACDGSPGTPNGDHYLVTVSVSKIISLDSDGDGIPDSIDNCPTVSNVGQENADGDALGDACDADNDNDGVPNVAEGQCRNAQDNDNDGRINDGCPQRGAISEASIAGGCDIGNAVNDDSPDDNRINDGCPGFTEIEACGSDDLGSASRPERIDGAFAGVDDDGNGAIDEALSPEASGFDCDGDGFKGSAEAHVYSYLPQMTGDQKTCQEYDTGFPNPSAGVRPSKRWPADLNMGTGSVNRITLIDLTTLLAPIRYFGTNVGTNPSDVRFDLNPGTAGGGATHINLLDLTALLAGATGNPPMLGGARAFGGPICPWP